MTTRVSVEIEGLGEVLGHLDALKTTAQAGLERQVGLLAKDGEGMWKGVTPQRTGRLQGADKATAQGLTATFGNSVNYYPFVDEGHNTPAGWRTRHGYRPAKRRSHVAGKEMTTKLVQYLVENVANYIAKFLDNG